jgi:hypothetical protein
VEKKYVFTLKGAIWWEKTSHKPFDLSHVVFINREIEANDAGEAIRAAKKIVKDLRKENPSRDHKDYGVKAELFLGNQPVWEQNFAKGKMSEEHWQKLKEQEPENAVFYKACARIHTIPPDPPTPIFRKTGVIHRHPPFSRGPVKGA